MKNFIKGLVPYVFIIIFVVAFRTLIATPVVVDGPSMEPTLKNGNLLILYKLPQKYNRFDVVIVKTKINGKKERLVKRVIGLPGDSIEYKNSTLFINGKKVKDKFAKYTNKFDLESLYNMKRIPNGYYFVMGDNRRVSFDSRDSRVGLISEKEMVGKAIFRFWPINKMGIINYK